MLPTKSRWGFAAALGTLVGLVLGLLLMMAVKSWSPFSAPDPVTIASGSLQAVREQARLTPFTARFVAVVTATQSRFGLKAQKTLILPGTVRYELDLAKLTRKDVRWDSTSKTLSVLLPPIELSGPEVDLTQIREYGGGGLLSALTDTRSALDTASRAAAQRELLRQARQPLPLKLARDAAKRAVQHSFALPLEAAGIDAHVVALFPEEAGRDPSFLDRSRSIEQVLNEEGEQRP